MGKICKGRAACAATVAAMLVACSPAAIGAVLGQVDDFEDGSTMNWMEGGPSPNPPNNVVSGGPSGANDNYLENVAAGTAGPGSRQIMFNQNQWAGDYVSAGVNRIDAMMANFGNSDLVMRVAIEGAAGTQYGSTAGATLPPDGNWYAVSFDLSAAGMGLIVGGDTLADVLSNAAELRILAASAGPTWIGDPGDSTLGVDNLTAAPEPSALALLALGGLAIARRR